MRVKSSFDLSLNDLTLNDYFVEMLETGEGRRGLKIGDDRGRGLKTGEDRGFVCYFYFLYCL